MSSDERDLKFKPFCSKSRGDAGRNSATFKVGMKGWGGEEVWDGSQGGNH